MDVSALYNDSHLQDAVTNSLGPAIINAGPGSGKTRLLCTKVAYLLTVEKIPPERIIVCTFTEKAANELVQRIKAIIAENDIELFTIIDFGKLRIGTIHSIFQQFIEDNISITEYKSGIKVLDEIERKVFLHRHISEFKLPTYTIPSTNGLTKVFYDFDDTYDVFFEDVDEWTLIDFMCDLFDDIVDQGIEITGLQEFKRHFESQESFTKLIDCYQVYKELLQRYNCIDFAQIQNIYWQMLQNISFREKIRTEIFCILVDEYQDTNYIQERALLESIGNTSTLTDYEHGELYPSKNITVVGDINQSLYRFRGAEIDNILTFNKKFSADVREYKLFANYRSNKNIINLSNEYIRPNLEYYKKIGLNPKDFIIYPGKTKDEYPILTFTSENRKMSGFAVEIEQFIQNLYNTGRIKRLNDVAILLPSIRYSEAEAFLSAFGERIRLPRHIDFFINPLVISIFRAFAQLYEVKTVNPFISNEFNSYFDNKLKLDAVPLVDGLAISASETPLIEVFYSILGANGIREKITEGDYRHIGLLSNIIQGYCSIYDTSNNSLFLREYLPYIYKNAEDIFIEDIEADCDKINLLTIHQSKGLQFPIVIVGYNKSVSNRTDISRYKDTRIIVSEAISRTHIELESDAEQLELRRLFYVAFSRAKDLLIIGIRTANKAKELNPVYFDYTIYDKEQINHFPNSFTYLPESQPENKESFSVTGDIETYKLCPQMYSFIKEYGLIVPDKDDFTFGKLVHQTIERVNKHVFTNKLNPDYPLLVSIAQREFDTVFSSLPNTEKIIDQKELAFRQIDNYLKYFSPFINTGCLHSIEESVSYETPDYVVKGRIDIVFRINNNFIIVDVKSGKKSNKTEQEIQNYESQVKLYAHVYKEKYATPIAVMIYSTGESNYKDGEYIVNNTGDTDEVIQQINDIILRIKNKDFKIDPDKLRQLGTCNNCPFKSFCKLRIL